MTSLALIIIVQVNQHQAQNQMSQSQLLMKLMVIQMPLKERLIVHLMYGVNRSLTPVLALAAQTWKLPTSRLTYLNQKAKEAHLPGTFRLLGTPNTNGLVCAHHLTRYSVRYAVV